MKKFLIAVLTAVFVIVPSFSPAASASYDGVMNSLGLYSDCLLLMSADNFEVIFEKNAGKQTSPASLTKIVTAIVVLENCPDLTARVTVPESCVRELDGTNGSMGGLKAGETARVYDLLRRMLIQSANEAATTLAYYVSGGDEAKFVAMMNETAAALGCNDSNFVNPHGLDDEDQYVSARDTAKFLLRAMEFPAFAEIVSKTSYTLPETNLQGECVIHSTNYMMNPAYKDYFCKYVKGGKTGSTSTAGRCVAAIASKDGYNYVGVALKSIFEDVDHDGVKENGAFLDCKKMFEWAFENIELVAIADSDDIVGQVPLKYSGDADYITLSPAETVYGLVPVGTNAGSLLVEPIARSVPKFLRAPVKKGDPVCKGRILYAGEPIREIVLSASSDASLSVFAFIGSAAKRLFSSPLFIAAACATAILLIILLVVRRRRRACAAAESGGVRILNYNDFMHLK